jgi:ubiquinone/menaquinone biosynthesis C-methylase UbiE
MPLLDKTDVLPRLATMPRVVLELGCGSTKRDSTAIGVDVMDLPGVDIVGDIFEVLSSFPATSVDAIQCYHFVEHLEDLPRLMQECARVMKGEATLTIVVPHFSNPYFYSDYTHRRFFGLYTFSYLAAESPFRRQVPLYGHVPRFRIDDVQLGFKSTRPFYVRHAIKRMQGALFNSSRWCQEWYEENLCWICPCYEVCYTLRRLP